MPERLTVFANHGQGRDLAWEHIVGAPEAGLLDLLDPEAQARASAPDADAPASRLVGVGAGALRALESIPTLRPRAVLAIAPDTAATDAAWASWRDVERLDVVATCDSLERDARFVERLRASGAPVRIIPTGLSLDALGLVAAQTSWLSDWAAPGSAEPDRAPDLQALWRDGFVHDLSVDLEASGLDAAGMLRLMLVLRNTGRQALDLRRLNALGLRAGLRLWPDGETEAEAGARAVLPGRRLACGEAARIELVTPGAPIAQREVMLKAALVCGDGFWLDAASFPSAILKASPEPEEEDAAPPPSRAPPATGPVAPAAAPRSPAAASRADVIACYRTFLGREPESDAVIEGHLAKGVELWPLIQDVAGSREAARWRIYRAAGDQSRETGDSRAIELELEGAQLDRLSEAVQAAWARRGREQPYFSTLANGDYLLERLTPAALEAFYATGQDEVTGFLDVLRRHRLEADPNGTVLELGCRVGRLAEPFAAAFGRYVGIDLAEPQLDLARQRLAARDVTGAEVMSVNAFMGGQEPVDVVFSILALQHLPPPLTRRWLAEALRRLTPGGIAYFQLPCLVFDYSFAVEPFLSGLERKGPLTLHALPQREVFRLLSEQGLELIEMAPSPRIGPTGVSYAFLARKPEVHVRPERADASERRLRRLEQRLARLEAAHADDLREAAE